MRGIESLAGKIADVLTIKLQLDKERRAVIRYGLIGLLQVITLFLLITFIGAVTGTLFENYIVFFTVGYLRKSTGGAHSRTMWGCNAVSVLSISILAIFSRFLLGNLIDPKINYGIAVLLFMAGLLIFHKYVPVDSPNKPIVSPEKIKRLRRESYMKLLLFFLLTLIAIDRANIEVRFYSISMSIRLALVWQMITLTKTGSSLLLRVDHAVNELLDLVFQRENRRN
ncbi:accessory gene regulator ArgB-like protein [Proteiniclasticum ruminis]|uniref:Accessory gene regulator B n=1 Tax=Proteiniclasticum ruminis TaxID=398199 RepID=A0A1G8SAE5_9CLOT|nr:accessory gene regulator B family protein [Proteiniclasticum ruminis]SDJ26188.1 accessory gene regulator B [Proteiniclasticum ruminis]